ncbi:hypothetical protein [Paraliobacillus salinarum]|nr:hypothetical protein [Paraliobacillus salinarum]
MRCTATEAVSGPTGTARAEDPLRKVFFFTELAEAVPVESEVSIDYGEI